MISDPAWRYPAALLTLITNQLAIVNANQSRRAGSGTAQAATAARDLALGKLQTMNDRVRFFYCSASDDEDQTPELAKIGKQPRRDRSRRAGRAGTVPRPGGHGDVRRRDSRRAGIGPRVAGARDLAARLPQVPARRDTAELAGTSTTTTVSPGAPGPARSPPA